MAEVFFSPRPHRLWQKWTGGGRHEEAAAVDNIQREREARCAANAHIARVSRQGDGSAAALGAAHRLRGAVCGAHWPQAADAGELKRAARDAGAVAGARRGLHLGVFRGRACGIRRAGLGRFAVGGLCRGVWRREQGAGGLGQSDRHDGLGAGRLRPHERAGAARTRRGRAAHFRLFVHDAAVRHGDIAVRLARRPERRGRVLPLRHGHRGRGGRLRRLLCRRHRRHGGGEQYPRQLCDGQPRGRIFNALRPL